jgi:hypothetical protein
MSYVTMNSASVLSNFIVSDEIWNVRFPCVPFTRGRKDAIIRIMNIIGSKFFIRDLLCTLQIYLLRHWNNPGMKI